LTRRKNTQEQKNKKKKERGPEKNAEPISGYSSQAGLRLWRKEAIAILRERRTGAIGNNQGMVLRAQILKSEKELDGRVRNSRGGKT